jgi:hypothetical protein
MQPQATRPTHRSALRVARLAAPHALALARWSTPRLVLPALALSLLWLALPYLLIALVLIVVLSGRRGGRRRRSRGVPLVELVALVSAIYGLRRQGKSFAPSWHPCEECGAPIDRPSRANYCSAACRRYARMRREAGGPTLEEVPF